MILISKDHAIETGNPYYFTGKPCRRGHVAKRKVSNGGCHECKKMSDSKRRETPEYKEMMRDVMVNRRNDAEKSRLDSERQKAHHNTESYRESVREYNNQYKKDDRAKYNAHDAARQAAKQQRTPSWLPVAAKNAILAIYEKARALTKETGIEYHVDHIVPLRGSFVSGLHVPWNLQIITAKENMIKNNRFDGVAI